MTSAPLSRRNFLKVAAGVTTGALIAGCAPAVQQGASSGEAGAAAEPIELSFDMYNFDPWLKALGEMYDVYMQENAASRSRSKAHPGKSSGPGKRRAWPPATRRTSASATRNTLAAMPTKAIIWS
jgi:hypothetical protein